MLRGKFSNHVYLRWILYFARRIPGEKHVIVVAQTRFFSLASTSGVTITSCEVGQ